MCTLNNVRPTLSINIYLIQIKNTTMNRSDFTLFIMLPVCFNGMNLPTIISEVSVMIGLDEDGDYVVLEKSIARYKSVVFNGLEITEYEKITRLVDMYLDLGINIDKLILSDTDDIIACSGDIKTFVFENTGIKLPD